MPCGRGRTACRATIRAIRLVPPKFIPQTGSKFSLIRRKLSRFTRPRCAAKTADPWADAQSEYSTPNCIRCLHGHLGRRRRPSSKRWMATTPRLICLRLRIPAGQERSSPCPMRATTCRFELEFWDNPGGGARAISRPCTAPPGALALLGRAAAYLVDWMMTDVAGRSTADRVRSAIGVNPPTAPAVAPLARTAME